MVVTGWLAAGCYITHEPVLTGERYTCDCRYTGLAASMGSVTWTVLPDGGVTPSGGGMVAPRENLLQTIHPCSDVMLPPAAMCATACGSWGHYPRVAIPGTGHYAGGADRAFYEGGGACDVNGAPSRRYVWPGVPAEAVRNGVLDTTASSVTITISGIGTETVVPSAGHISISGGGCEVTGGHLGGSCPEVVVHDFGFELPNFTLGGESVTGARLRHSGVDPAGPLERFRGTYEYRGPAFPSDLWSHSGGWMPLELEGFVAGEPVDSEFRYMDNSGDLIVADRHTVPTANAINVRQGPAWEKFMHFDGVARRADIAGRAVEVEFDLAFTFFSGSPLVSVSLLGSPFDGSEVVLDGSATIDDLGGSPVLYEWFVAHPLNRAYSWLIAYGERASVPRAVLDSFTFDVNTNPAQGPDMRGHLCLRVWDSDDHYDEHCSVWPALPGPAPALGCADVGISWPSTYRFRRIVELAGWVDAINDYAGDFTMVVPTNDLLDAVEAVHPGLEAWALSSASNAATFAAYFMITDDWTWSSLAPLPLWGIPTRPVGVDRSCGSPNSIPPATRWMHVIGPDL